MLNSAPRLARRVRRPLPARPRALDEAPLRPHRRDGRQLRRGRAAAGHDRRRARLDHALDPRRPLRAAARGRRVPARPRPARRRDARRDHRRRRHAVQRLPDRHDRLGDLLRDLPAGREHGHPAAHPGAGGRGAPVRRARLRAVREHAVRRARRAAGDPGRRRDPDHDPRGTTRSSDTPAEDLPPPGVPAPATGRARPTRPSSTRGCAGGPSSRPVIAAMPPPSTKPATAAPIMHLLLVVAQVLAPVGGLGDLAAQPLDGEAELGAVGLDRAPDLLRCACVGHQLPRLRARGGVGGLDAAAGADRLGGPRGLARSA